MSDTTGKGTPSGNPTFSGPDKYASTTVSVKSLNATSYRPTAPIAPIQGGLTPGSFAAKVLEAKPTTESRLLYPKVPVGSEVKRPKIDPETQRLSELGKLAEEYGITFTTDAAGNKALEVPPDFVDTEPAPDQGVPVLQEMVPLAVEYGELRKEMMDGLPNISDPSAETVVRTLIEECDMLVKLVSPNKEHIEQLKDNLDGLKDRRRFIVYPTIKPADESKKEQASEDSAPSPVPIKEGDEKKEVSVSASQERAQGEETLNEKGRFKKGDVVRLMDGSGEIADWNIREISRKGMKMLAVVERGGKTRTLKIQMLRKLAEETKKYEEEQRANKSSVESKQEHNLEKERVVSHPPISQFFTALQNPQHTSKQLMGWYRSWVESGKIDEYRKEHANVQVPDVLISFAKSTFPTFAEAFGRKDLSLETRSSARTSLIFYVRYLTGVLEEEDKNKEVVEYNIKNSVIPEGNVIEMKRLLAEAKLKETQVQVTNKTILRPAGAFKVGQTLNLRGRGNIKVTKENVDDLNREYEEKKFGQTRQASHEKELADTETQKMYQDAFELDRPVFLSLYLDQRENKQTGEIFYTRNERLLKHPYRAFIEKVLSENGVVAHDRLLPEEKLLDEKMDKDRGLAQEYEDFMAGRGGSLAGHRGLYTPPLDPHSPQIDKTQKGTDGRGQYRVFPATPRPTDLSQEEKEAYVESSKGKSEKEIEEIERSLRQMETNHTHSDMESMARVDIVPDNTPEQETVPSKKSKAVEGILSLFQKQRGPNWKAWITAIVLGTASGIASAKPPAERIIDSSTAQTAPQGGPWKELFLETSKNKERAEVFAEDIVSLNSEALMRKYAASHFTGHNDPTKMRLALNWRGDDVVQDNTGEHFGHLSNKERMEFSDLWDLLQKISMSLQGRSLQSRTYEDAIKEVKQLISSRT